MDDGGREVAIDQDLAEVLSAVNRLGEDNHLVELYSVEDVEELLELLFLREAHVELLETVECELRVVSNKNLKRLFLWLVRSWRRSSPTFLMNLLQTGRIFSLRVAENIITCF